MSRQNRMIAFRPPPEVLDQIIEYQRAEHRSSASEAVTVLVLDALERWRLSRPPCTREDREDLRQCPVCLGRCLVLTDAEEAES